ncbi:uncharacterized protein DS421_11g326300 [Arachis hypogaea]|nr:uncharacterized protein DS421_11g326300 [Arachis hypogaea]
MPHLSHFTCQKHSIQLAHGHIEVTTRYTRYSCRRDSSFGVISGVWADFARLCNFKLGCVGVFEVVILRPVTIHMVQTFLAVGS